MGSEHEFGRLAHLKSDKALEQFRTSLNAVQETFGLLRHSSRQESAYPAHFLSILGVVSGLRKEAIAPVLKAEYDTLIADATNEEGVFDPVRLFELLSSRIEEDDG